MSQQATVNLEPRVAALESEIKTLSQNFTLFATASETWRHEVSRALTGLSDKITDKTAPNFATMAAWAGVVLLVIFGILTPVATSMVESSKRDRDDSRRGFDQLDTKLQKEMSLALAALDKGILAVENVNRERTERNGERLKRLEDWSDYRMRAELEDYRALKLKLLAP